MSNKRSRYQILQEQYAQQPGVTGVPPPPQVTSTSSPYVPNQTSPVFQPAPSFPTPMSYQPSPTPQPAYSPQQPNSIDQAPKKPAAPMEQGLDPLKLPSPTRGFSPAEVAETELEVPTFSTQMNLDASVPPRPDSDYIVNDAYNASSRFMRMSMYQVPTTSDIWKSTHIPFSMIMQPFAEVGYGEVPVPVVDMGPDGPIRCSRCRAYINPFVVFSQSGSKFSCGFCGMSNDVPPAYFSPVIGTQRSDIAERFELWRGSVDFVATPAYQSREPQPPTYLFLVETTHKAVQCGMLESFSLAMQRILPSIFAESNARVGFITYDSSVSFFNINPNLSQPQMVVVSDPNNAFVPLPNSSFIAKYSDAKNNIHKLLEGLPSMFADSVSSITSTGAALKIAAKAISATGGKILLFTASLPNHGLGILKKRDQTATLESDKEKTLFKPQSEFYTKLAEVCSKHAICVDLFIGASSYIDINTLSEVSKATGGQIYYYPSFAKHLHQEQLFRELYRNLSRESAFDSLLRLRCSQGVSITKEHGHFTKINETDISIAQISSDSTLSFDFEYDDNLKEENGILFQAAILYTSKDGRRMIRVHNLKVIVTSKIDKVFKFADLDAVINSVTRQIAREIPELPMPEIRKKYVTKASQILTAYRKFVAKGSRDGQLILPDSLKLLPIYSLGLLKLPLFGPIRGGTQFHSLPDTRAYFISLINTMPLRDLSPLMYPILFEVHNMASHPFHGVTKETGFVQFPGQCRLLKSSLLPHGVYLLDTYHRLYLWIGENVDENILNDILPPEYLNAEPSVLIPLPRIETELSSKIFNLLSCPRLQRSLSPEIYVIRQNSPLEPRILKYLIEDGPKSGKDVKDMNYVDFLCHIHKKIQTSVN